VSHVEERYLKVMGAAVEALGTDAVFVIGVDNLMILHVNRAFTRLFGYSREEAAQVSLYDFVAAERDNIDGYLRKIHAAGEFTVGVRPYRHRDGHIVEAETRVGITTVEGRPLYCVVSRDLSEVKRAQRAQAESDLRFRTLSEAAFEAIALSSEGVLVDGNQPLSELLGAPVAGLVGRSVTNFVAPEWAERVRTRFQAEAGEPFEHVMLRVDGTRVDVESQAKVIEADGKRLRVTAIRDITKKKKLEADLLAAQRLESVGRLAGGVAHDFNNLLTVVLSLVDMLLVRSRSEDEADDLRQIREAADRAANLTQQLLAFARRKVIEPKVISLNELAANLERILRRVLGEHIKLITRLERDLGAVLADPGQIEQVIMNLSVNARDAMPGGGTLLIETQNVELGADYASAHPGVVPGPHVLVAVTDTGSGIAAEHLKHVFEPFFTTKGPNQGSGLGLATSYGIVKQCGGSIHVYSEVGRGTTFKVYFPRVFAAFEQRLVQEKPLVVGGSETLLLVEDDAMVRALAARILSKHGYEVILASGPSEALRAFAAQGQRIAALVTDVVLPEMSGKDLADRLREVRSDIAVLYTSGYTENTVVHQGIVDEGVHFLAKPYLPADLLRKIREVLDGE